MNRLNIIVLSFIVAVICVNPSNAQASALADIEAALVAQDYESVNALAKQAQQSSQDVQVKQEAEYYLALSYLYLKDYDASREIFSRLVSTQSDKNLLDKSYLGLFNAYFLDGNYNLAKDIIEKFLNQSGKSQFTSLALLKAARVHLKLSQWQKAHEYLSAIISKYPDSFEAHTAKQLLDEKQYFAVQVGAFLERGRAEDLVNELKSVDQYAYIIQTVDRQARTFYRVRVGKISLLNEAFSLQQKLAKQGYPTEIYP